MLSSIVEQERKHTLILLEAMPTAEVQANCISYNAAISSCEKAGEWQRALSLFEAMGLEMERCFFRGLWHSRSEIQPR